MRLWFPLFPGETEKDATGVREYIGMFCEAILDWDVSVNAVRLTADGWIADVERRTPEIRNGTASASPGRAGAMGKPRREERGTPLDYAGKLF